MVATLKSELWFESFRRIRFPRKRSRSLFLLRLPLTSSSVVLGVVVVMTREYSRRLSVGPSISGGRYADLRNCGRAYAPREETESDAHQESASLLIRSRIATAAPGAQHGFMDMTRTVRFSNRCISRPFRDLWDRASVTRNI